MALTNENVQTTTQNELFNSLPFASASLNSCVYFDLESHCIRFLLVDKKLKSVTFKTEVYKEKQFDDNFFEMLKGILTLHKAELNEKVSIVLPDNLFVTDTVKVPAIKTFGTNNNLLLAIDAIYKNSKDIKFNSFILHQNKQNATYSICGLKKDIITKVTDCFNACSIPVGAITFASNALVNYANLINPKLKSACALMLDIKKDFSRIAFIVNGKTVSYFSLPFGYSILGEDKVYYDCNLFNHSPAERLVITATEKAKKKNYIMQERNNDYQVEQNTSSDASTSFDSDFSFRKVNRKPPKFAIRPEPQSREEFAKENFRNFEKWAIELIKNNPEIFAPTKTNSIFVNLPIEYSFLLSENEQSEFNFLPFSDNSISNEFCSNPELVGGLFTKKFNKHGNF